MVFYVGVQRANGVKPFILDGETGAESWLKVQGRKNIDELNKILKKQLHLV